MAEDELARQCDRAYPRLVGLLTLRTGDHQVAQELAQDTLVELCRAWPDVRDPQAWVTTVALRRSASWWRRRAAERRALHRHGPDDHVAEPAPVARDLALLEAVAALPRRQQEVLLLRFYVGLDVEETADRLGCPPGTVTSRTHRAIERLRAAGHDRKETLHVD